MNRYQRTCAVYADSMPHRRGDEPKGLQRRIELIAVCPTGVGMNRENITPANTMKRMPHRRGDEPALILADIPDVDVCPTGVGMNRYFYRYLPDRIPYAPQAWG